MLAKGLCHLPLWGLNPVLLQLLTFDLPWRQLRVKNESLCTLGKLENRSCNSYFQELISRSQSFVVVVQLLSCVHFFGKLIDCSLPVSSVHGIFQTRILEWAAIPFSRKSFWLKAPTHVSCIGSRVLYHWDSMELGLGSSFLILLQNLSRFWYVGSITVDLSETQSLVLEDGNTCDTIDPLRIIECSQTDFSILKHFIIQRL